MGKLPEPNEENIPVYIAKAIVAHASWAEYFEQNPEAEKRYVASGEWDTAQTHRRWVAFYELIREKLNVVE